MEWRVFLTFIAYIRYIFLFKYTVLTYIITYSKKKKRLYNFYNPNIDIIERFATNFAPFQ